MGIEQIKIFGERHTASNAAAGLIQQNFSQRLLDYGFLGWKHRLAPQQKEWRKRDLSQTLVVVTVRNPYSWLKAMHRDPYNQHMPMLQKLPFVFFLQHSIEDYENVLQMWNQKYHAYLRLLEEVPHGMVIKAEELAADQADIFAKLQIELGENTPQTDFKPFERYVNGFGEQKKDYQQVTELPQLNQQEQDIIKQSLNADLMKQLGYDFLSDDPVG